MSFFGTPISQPKQQRTLLNISDDQLSSNQQVVPVTYLAGRGLVTGMQISPGYNQVTQRLTTSSGKGSSTTSGYRYFADFALIFCMGGRVPVKGIRSVVVNSELLWTGSVDFGSAEYVDITVEGHGQMRVYKGSWTQPIDPLVLTTRGVLPVDVDPRDTSTWPANAATGGQITNSGIASGDSNPLSGHYDQHGAYRGQCYAVFKDWNLGRDQGNAPNIQLELIRDVPFIGSTELVAGTTLASDDRGVPIAGVLYDWLTDPVFGMWLPEAKLLTASFTALNTALPDFRISPVVTEQSDFREAWADLLSYFDGWCRTNAGQLEVGYWKHSGIDTTGLPILDDDNFDDEPKMKPTGWGNTVNEVTVSYSDREHYFNTREQVYRNPNNQRIVGEPRPVVLQKAFISDATIAKQFATEYGAYAALPSQAGTLDVKRESLQGANWPGGRALPGMLFKMNTNTYGESLVCRINEIETAEDKSGKATLTIEAERALWPTIYSAPPAAKDGDFFVGAVDIVNKRVVELPQGLKDPGVTANQIAVLAQRFSTNVVGFRVYGSQDDWTFDLLSAQNTFAVFGTLGADYSHSTANPDVSTGVEIYLFGVDLNDIVSQSDQSRDNNTWLLWIDDEIMSVGEVTALGDGLFKLFVRRGQYGTTIADHVTGAECWFIQRAKLTTISNRNFTNGAEFYFKLQPYTNLQDFDLAETSSFSYTFAALDVVPAPSISPGSQSFDTPFNSIVDAPAGLTVRYGFGTDATTSSPEWPIAGGVYTNLLISFSVTLYARCFTADGRASDPAIVTYTLVASGGGGGGTVATPRTAYTGGPPGHGAMHVTASDATAGSTLHYRVNGGSWNTYTTGVTITIGQIIEFYASASGMANSPIVEVDNIDPNL